MLTSTNLNANNSSIHPDSTTASRVVAVGYAIIDKGSQSIELVAKTGDILHSGVLNLGYRVAYEKFFAPARNPNAARTAFLDRLKQDAVGAPFMKDKREPVGIEFGEMAEILFPPAQLEGRVLALEELKQKSNEVCSLGPSQFKAGPLRLPLRELRASSSARSANS